MMGMIKRSAGYKAPINARIYLYNTHVRSNLEHSSAVWSTFNFIEAIVCIQQAATRYILNYPDLLYNERCRPPNLI